MKSVQITVAKFTRWVTVSFALIAGASQAGIILDTGESVIINYDFTAQSPAPTFPLAPGLTVSTVVGDRDYLDEFLFELFGDLNANSFILGGAFTCSDFPTCVPITLTVSTTASGTELDDGMFSLRVTSIQGTLDVTAGTALATDAAGVPVSAAPQVGAPQPSIPEPATLALLGLGLAGLAATRKRKLH